MFYIRTAERLQRTAPWVESFEGGLEVSDSLAFMEGDTDDKKLKRILLDDELGICQDLEDEMERLVGSYVDEWKTATQDPTIRKKFKQFVNSVSFLMTMAWTCI